MTDRPTPKHFTIGFMTFLLGCVLGLTLAALVGFCIGWILTTGILTLLAAVGVL